MVFIFCLPAITIQISSDDGAINGEITFSQEGPESKLKVTGSISGLEIGQHGFHVHETADLVENCKNAGFHFNPSNVRSVRFKTVPSPSRHYNFWGLFHRCNSA